MPGRMHRYLRYSVNLQSRPHYELLQAVHAKLQSKFLFIQRLVPLQFFQSQDDVNQDGRDQRNAKSTRSVRVVVVDRFPFTKLDDPVGIHPSGVEERKKSGSGEASGTNHAGGVLDVNEVQQCGSNTGQENREAEPLKDDQVSDNFTT